MTTKEKFETTYNYLIMNNHAFRWLDDLQTKDTADKEMLLINDYIIDHIVFSKMFEMFPVTSVEEAYLEIFEKKF